MKKTLISLIIPIINTVVFSFSTLGQRENAIGLLVCGILPIILTLKWKIDTSKYIGLRFILFILSVVYVLLIICVLSSVNVQTEQYVNSHDFILYGLFYFAPVLYLAGSSVFFHKKFRYNRERVVLFLSNPVLCFIIWFIVFMCTFTVLEGL